MVRANHYHHSSGPWSLKDPVTIIGNSGTRGRTVSTRILGIGIALVGVLFLAVGLIMGLQFPNYVREQNKEKQCVINQDHSNYNSWSHGSQWNRKVYMYYWTLVNANDFLQKGQKPRLTQKGPYVYTETDRKYNVNFAATEVSYRLRRHYEFDKETTEVACSTCSEHDMLTILSPWYLKTVGQHGGEEALSWTHIPTYTSAYLKGAGFIARADGDLVFSHNISVLGKFVSKTTIFSGSPLANFSFGSWLHDSREAYKSTIEARRVGQDFTLSEVRSLYKVLTNLTLLGGKALSEPATSLHKQCKQWAHSICSSVPPVLKLTTADCGIIYVLNSCHSNFSSDWITILQQTFCSSSDTNACFNFRGLPEDLLQTYVTAISDFLWHLSYSVLTNFLESKDLSLVVSRNQSLLALGFNVSGDDVFQGVHVTGLLHFNSLGETHPPWKVYTCLEQRNMQNNMKVKEFNNSWSSPDALLRGHLQQSVSSHTDYVAPCTRLTTCRVCLPPGSTLSFFCEDLVRAIPFTLHSNSSLSGVSVFKYELHPNAFSWSSTLKIQCGLQNMTEVVGYLSWASLPHLAGSHMDHIIMAKDGAPSNSYVLVEPVTGKVWEKNVRLQWNFGVTNESAHVLDRNISVAGLPLPVFWAEKVATITNQEIEAHKHLVTRIMAVSCGGIIGFSVIAVVVFMAGVVVCVYPFKPNRISPVLEDTSSVPNGRHL